MSDFNTFDKIINRKNTYSTHWDYTKDKFGKDNLLPFAISDMDFETPKPIIDAIKKRAEKGAFGYTRWDNDDYINSIANWYKRRFKYNIDKKTLCYGTNALYLFLKLVQLYNPNKGNVAIFLPCFDYFSKILKHNDYHLATIEISDDLKNSNFEEMIAKSKIFILCNPNNPCGKVWEKEKLTYMLEICKKYNVPILSDEIYMDIVYKPYKFTTMLEIAEELDYLSNVCVITSASKTFNISGLGGGYGIVPNQKIRETLELISKEKESISSGFIFGITATIAGYNDCEQWVDNLLGYCYNNLVTVKSYLEENIPEITMKLPQGTYFAWLNCSNLNISAEEIQDKLVSIGNTAIIDGLNHYSSSYPSLRMNVACPLSKLTEGLKRLAISLKN